MKPPLQFSHIFRRGLALLLAVLLLTALMLPSAAFAEGDVPAGDAGGEPVSGDGTDPVVPPESGEAAEEGAGQIAAVSPVDNGPSAGGSIASADGNTPSADDGDELPSEVEFFLASDGSDANDGSPEAPFATLSHAAEVASGTDAGCVILILLTDLVSEETASFSSGSFILTSGDAICTISRGDGLRDPDSEAPLIAVGDAGRYAEDGTTAELVLEYVVLDDSEGSASSGAAVEVSDGAKLVVGDDASIYARDGKAAVQGDPEAEICVGAGGEIIGDTPFQAEEGCIVNVDDGAAVPGYAPSEDEPEENLEDAPQNEPQDEPEDEPQGEPGDESQDKPGDSEEVKSTDASGTPEVAGDAGIPAPPADEAAPGDDDPAGGTTEDPDNPTPSADEAAPGDDDPAGGTAENPEANTEEGSELTENTGSLLGANRILSAGSPMLAAAAPLAAPNVPDGLSLSAPDSISHDEELQSLNTDIANTTGYLIPYTISYKLADTLSSLASIGALVVQDIVIEMVLTLPDYVHPQYDGAAKVHTELNYPDAFQVTEAVLSGTDISLKVEQASQTALASLTDPLQLSIDTILPQAYFSEYATPNAYTIGNILNASVTVNDVQYTFNSQAQSLGSLGSASAETTLLGDKTVKLVYDPLGGAGDPEAVMCSEQEDYPLETNNVPAHDPVDGTNVIFVGWSETEDQTIYDLNGELPPGEIVETVNMTNLGENKTKTVYAVYGYDHNGDGIPDVLQEIVTLTYDANGGSGAPGPQYGTVGTNLLGSPDYPDFTIPEQEPTRQYYTFLGWAEAPDATEAAYRYDGPGSLNKNKNDVSSDTTLYAVWEANPVYTLTFNGNGSDVSNVPNPVSAPSENQGGVYMSAVTIPPDEPTRSKYAFVGWAETADATEPAYDPGETITIEEDTTLYAVWVRYYTLYFNGTGASDAPDPISAPAIDGVATMIIPDKVPTRSRYDFLGWSPTRYGSAAFVPGEEVKLTGGDVTLYAVWKRNASSTGSFSTTTTNGKAPRTGDGNNPLLYAALAAGSAAALSGVVHVLKKKRS